MHRKEKPDIFKNSSLLSFLKLNLGNKAYVLAFCIYSFNYIPVISHPDSISSHSSNLHYYSYPLATFYLVHFSSLTLNIHNFNRLPSLINNRYPFLPPPSMSEHQLVVLRIEHLYLVLALDVVSLTYFIEHKSLIGLQSEAVKMH